MQPSSSFPRQELRPLAKQQTPPTSIVMSLISFFLVILFLTIGLIFLISPSLARQFLYPCLVSIEDDSIESASFNSNHSPVVESDMIRLSGACFLSISFSSIMLIIPTLQYFHNGKKTVPASDVGDGKDDENLNLSKYFFFRTLLFLQATLGLGLVGVGLFNLWDADSHHSYDEEHLTGDTSNYPQHHHCSSIKDQTILWLGVVTIICVSLGLISSFWPKHTPIQDESSDIDNRHQRGSKIWCCWRNRSARVISSDNSSEPLLNDRHTASLEEGVITSKDVKRSNIVNEDRSRLVTSNSQTVDEETSKEFQEEDGGDSYSQSSRLRGTSRLLKLAGSESLYLWVGIAVLLIRLPFSLSIPHFVSSIIGNLIEENYDGAKRSVLLLFLLGTVDSVLDFWCIFLFGYAQENIVRGVRVDTFSAILRQEQAFFDKTNTGDLISRLTSDCDGMAGDLTWFFRFSVEAAVRITGISIYMILRCPFLGLCALGILPAVGVINKLYGDWLSKNAISVQNSLASATSSASETLACVKTVITSASEDFECEKYSKKIDELYKLNIRQLIATGIYFMAVSTFLINTCVQSALLLLGSFFVEQGKLTPEILLAFMLYQGQLQEYTLNLFQSFSSLIKSSGAGDRVFMLLDRSPAPPGTGNPSVKTTMRSSFESKTGEDIVINEVAFSYPSRPESLALNRLSLDIKKGSLVALVGHSGCGKSTIISLLERLYDPIGGTISFGGIDLKNLNVKLHREKIGLVTQDPVLFTGSISDNIAYGSSVSFRDIIEAARIANAHDFIESFPQKYDTQVGERGMNLSGGQKQRIAIARAVIKKPALLLLDEATSALDPESEAAVQEALNDLLRNREGLTTIIVAHRLQTVRNAQLIAVIDNGRVIEQGSHNELIRNERGPYRRMVDRADSMGILPEC